MDGTGLGTALSLPGRAALLNVGPVQPARSLSSDRTVRSCRAGIRVYREDQAGAVGVGLPCGKRSCPSCRPQWIARGFRSILAGMHGPAPEYRVLTLTAPGFDAIRTGDSLVAWNATWARRFDRVRRSLARAAPGCEFVRVVELQKRGAIHVHAVFRGASSVSRSRVRRFVLSAGFGPRIDWAPVKSSEGLAHYLAGYMAKSRDEFPPGTRVLERSRGWDQTVDGDALRAGRVALRVFADVLDERWYGGPPPGVSWLSWAEDRSGVMAGRLWKRRRRARDGLFDFELRTRDRFARWLSSDRGRAALARRGGAALVRGAAVRL